MRHPMDAAACARCTERTARRRSHSREARRLDATASARCLTVSTALVATLACGGADERTGSARASRADAASGATAVATPGAPPTAAKPICPATGSWQVCSVVERLERAGLAPRREPNAVREPPLTTPGIALLLGRSELRIFLYPDRVTRERDQSRLDSAKYVAASQPLSMQAEPTVIASENLLAILRSRSDHQRERVSDALTAGPPQRPGVKS